MNQQSINKTLICFNQLGIVFKETGRVLCRICNSIIAMPPCGHIWNKRFERPLDCRYFQIQTDDFYQSWSEHFSTWTAALVRYRGAFPGDDSAFWRTFLSLRERESWERSATAARQRLVAMTTAEASLAGWFVWREKFTWEYPKDFLSAPRTL